MAFDTKYQASFPTTDGMTMDLSVQFDGAFTPTTVTLGPEAVIATVGKPNASILDWHKPLEVQIQLANEDTALLDIMAQADEDVLLIFGENGGDNHFKCYLKNQGHYRTLGQAEAEDFYSVVSGSDGIDLLKRKGFVPESVFTSYTDNGVGHVREVVFYILNQLGLGLPFTTSSNWYPIGGGAGTVDPLGTFLVDVGRLQDRLFEERGTASSYEILRQVCERYRLRISQVPKHGWLIEQRSMKFNSTQKAWLYNAAGTYTGTDPTTDAITAIGYDDVNLRQHGRGAFRLRKTHRTARITYAHGVASQLLTPNGDFSEFDAAVPEFPNWTATGFTPKVGSIGNGPAGATPVYPLLWEDDPSEVYTNAFADFATTEGGFIQKFWSYTTARKIGNTADDKINFQMRCGCALIRDAANDIPQYDQFWTAYSIFRVQDAKYLDADGEFASALEVRIPLKVDGDGWAAINRTFDASTTNSLYTIRLYRLVDPVPATYVQSDEYIGRNVQGFAWDQVAVKYIPAGTPENTARHTLVSVPAQSPLADDDQITDKTFFIGTGPDDFNPSRLLLESDESTIEEIKLDNGTADGSEIAIDRLWGRDVMRQVVTPQEVYEFELTADTVPIEAWRHLTIGSFNYDLMYFTRKYRTARCKGQYVQVRFDTWTGGEIVTVDPDISGTFIPPNDKRPIDFPAEFYDEAFQITDAGVEKIRVRTYVVKDPTGLIDNAQAGSRIVGSMLHGQLAPVAIAGPDAAHPEGAPNDTWEYFEHTSVLHEKHAVETQIIVRDADNNVLHTFTHTADRNALPNIQHLNLALGAYDSAAEKWEVLGTWRFDEDADGQRWITEVKDYGADPTAEGSLNWGTPTLDTTTVNGNLIGQQNFVVGTVAKGKTFHIFVRGENSNLATPEGPVYHAEIHGFAIDDFIGGFNGLPCLPLGEISRWFLYPHIPTPDLTVVKNFNQAYAAVPDASIVDDGAFITFDDVEGLISTDTGATRHVRIPELVVGSNWVRFQAVGHNIAKTAGAETIFYMKAGTATEYKLTKQADGTLRFAVTSNGAESTVNVDTTIAAAVGKSYQWFIGIELSSESPAPATLYLKIRTDTLATERVTGVQTNDCSGEPYEIYELYEGPTSSRIIYGEADTPIRSTTQFVATANCLQQFSNSKGGGLTFGTDHDAYLVTDATNFTVYDFFDTIIGQIAHGATTTHFARPAYDPLNGLFVFAGIDGKVYSWALGDVSVTLEHDFGGTIKCRGLVWSNTKQRLYAITEDSGSGDFGHFTNRTGTWAWNSFDTTFEFSDFQINRAGDRMFALRADGVLGLYRINADGSLTQLDTNSITGAVAVGYRDGQGFYVQVNDGSVVYLVEEDDLGGDQLTTLTSAHVAGSPGLALRNWGLHGYAVVSISAADHILKFDFDELDQGTGAATVSDRGAVGDTCRGIALARVGVAPPGPITDLAITAVTSTTFTLEWTDPGEGETGIKIWQRQNDSGPWLFKENVAVGAETVTVTGYGAEEEWCFKAQPFNAAGSANLDDCNSDCATTLAVPATPDRVAWYTGENTPNTSEIKLYELAGLTLSATLTVTHNDNVACRRISHDPDRGRFYFPTAAAGDADEIRSITEDGLTETDHVSLSPSDQVENVQYITGQNRVYFIASGATYQMGYHDIDDGPPEQWTKTLVATPNVYRDQYIAFAPGRRYGIHISGDRDLYREDLDGTNQTLLVSGVTGMGLTVDEENSEIYLTDSADGKLKAYNLSGVHQRDVYTLGVGRSWMSGQLAVGGGKVYWVEHANSQADFYLRRANTDGTSVETIASFTGRDNTQFSRGICLAVVS